MRKNTTHYNIFSHQLDHSEVQPIAQHCPIHSDHRVTRPR